MQVSVKVTGFTELLEALQLLSNFEEPLDEVNVELAERLAAKMKLKVRVKTGKLQRSIRAEKTDTLVIVIVMLYYSVFLEFGTSRMPPYPFIQPSLQEVGSEIVELLKQRVESLIGGA